MWVIAVFHQVSLFSLKPSDVTSTGGRSLLIPTPFSIKMALLDVALRNYGVRAGATHFPLFRDLVIAMSPPQQIIVNNCFVRIQKLRRPKSYQGGMKNRDDNESEGEMEQEANDEGKGPYIRSVAFREYVQYSGPLGLALQVETQQTAEQLALLWPQVNYLGKRGSFFQIDGPPVIQDYLPIQQGYLRLDEEQEAAAGTLPGYTLQVLDDCSTRLAFDQVNIYSGISLKMGRDRIVRLVQLPYRVIRSSHGFTLYQRTDQR